MQPDPTERPNTATEKPHFAGLLLELERTRSALDEAAAEKEELQAKLKSADRRVEMLIRKLDEANTRLDAATRQVDELSRQVEATNRHLDEAQRGEAELRQLLARMQAQLESALRASAEKRKRRPRLRSSQGAARGRPHPLPLSGAERGVAFRLVRRQSRAKKGLGD